MSNDSMNEIRKKGCLYWDESSRGIKNGKPDKRGRWCAEMVVNERRVRMRSSDINRCMKFLEECSEIEYLESKKNEKKRKPKVDVIEVPTIHDSRFMVSKHHVASMAQREQMLQDRIYESQLTLDYWKTRDFAAINRHIEKIVLPRLNVYCTERLHMRREMKKVILECIAILYTYLYADVPIFGYEYKVRSMLRYYKKHGNLGYYEAIPEPIHQAVDSIDFSILEKKYVVKRNK